MDDLCDGGLNRFQIDVAGNFFDLPGSVGFLLAGGRALIAQGCIVRETDDLNFSAQCGSDINAASDALIAACEERGWQVGTVRTGADFRRFRATRPRPGQTKPEVLYVDLALGAPSSGAASVTIAGPSLAPRELAIRTTLALFGRAEPRDFTNVRALHRRFDRNELLRATAKDDAGFDLAVFVQMIRSHRRLRDEDFPRTDAPVEDLRTYFDDWADHLDRCRDPCPAEDPETHAQTRAVARCAGHRQAAPSPPPAAEMRWNEHR